MSTQRLDVSRATCEGVRTRSTKRREYLQHEMPVTKASVGGGQEERQEMASAVLPALFPFHPRRIDTSGMKLEKHGMADLG